ncbi:hypothetical protein IP69_20855 [Bosea sp. AAP35]|nr:hypothetical protein IP69_20855 [Bosea sp. AAP35]
MAVAPWQAIAKTPAAGSEAHPFVFTDRDSLSHFIGCDSPSTKAALRMLEQRCVSYLREVAKYSQPFTGCNLSTYYQDFTNEHRGATEVLSTFATYAYLSEIGRSGFGQEKLASQALQGAREILLSWARSGIRDGARFRGALSQYCDEKGTSSLDTRFAIGLTFGRGTPALVNAVDLLLALSVFTSEEADNVDRFLSEIASLITHSSNFRAQRSNLDCNRFSNHVSIHLAALASIARLRHDRQGLAEIALGQGGAIAISWSQQVAKAIYGPGQTILNCYKPGESWEFTQTVTPQAGEIVDRYRARQEQTFGYPMFSLTYLLLTLKVLSRSNLRNVAAIAEAQARITSALDYYGAYFARYLSAEEVRMPANFQYPGANQYAGKLLSRTAAATITGSDGHLLPFLIAAPLMPGNVTVKAVIARAKQYPPHRPFSAVTSLYLTDVCTAVL